MNYHVIKTGLFLFVGVIFFSTCEDKDVDNVEQNIVNENKLLLKWIGQKGGNCYNVLYYVINQNDLDLCDTSYPYDCDEIILHLDVKMGTSNNYNLLTYTLKSNPSVNLSTTISVLNYEWEELDN